MPDQETTIQESAVHEPAVEETALAQDEWSDEPVEELPRRPRRRLLATPLPLALLGVLLLACGFIAGVLVEKGQTPSSSSGGGVSGLASRFAALRGSGGASGVPAGGTFVGGGAGAGATIGQVAYIDGSTLYVTDAEGNTVKVRTSAGSTVTKTVKADVKGIHPGETVVITGATGSGGTIDAESIRVGGGAGGDLGALFGGSGGAGGEGRGAGSGGGSSGGGEPALFGKGG
ncbi:MAG TPA: hypothetical protein VG053_04500 [Solirubrobacteraceae bacterium]|jgi:hypothetical protein|nr:hypothetical protein [Solirubrobacteraceae bacterium]